MRELGFAKPWHPMGEKEPINPPQHRQPQPGVPHAMRLPPQSEARHHRGSGKLEGKVAMVTARAAASDGRSRFRLRDETGAPPNGGEIVNA